MESYKRIYLQTLNLVQRLSSKTNKMAILIILQNSDEEDVCIRVPIVRESISNIISFITIGNTGPLPYIVESAQGIIDRIIIDSDYKRNNSISIVDTAQKLCVEYNIPFATYSDYESWAGSSIYFIDNVCKKNKVLFTGVALVGNSFLSTKLILKLLAKRITVFVLKDEYENAILAIDKKTSININSDLFKVVNDFKSTGVDVLIGTSLFHNNPYLNLLSDCNFKLVFDVGVNNFSVDYITYLRERDVQFYRSDDRAGLTACIIQILETDFLVNNNQNRVELNNIHVTSGGIIGNCGDIIVDNANNPSVIFGVAKGDGTFKSNLSAEDEEKLTKIKKLIHGN